MVTAPDAHVRSAERAGKVVVLRAGGTGTLSGAHAQSVTRTTCGLPARPGERDAFATDVMTADLDSDGRAELLVAVTDPSNWSLRGYCVLPGTPDGVTRTGAYYLPVPKPGHARR